jgi:hypothetical protein
MKETLAKNEEELSTLKSQGRVAPEKNTKKMKTLTMLVNNIN